MARHPVVFPGGVKRQLVGTRLRRGHRAAHFHHHDVLRAGDTAMVHLQG